MDDEQAEDVAVRLFVLLTMKYEDGAALAAEGQSRDVLPASRMEVASRLQALSGEHCTLADATALIATLQQTRS
jgi:hypothetical protein